MYKNIAKLKVGSEEFDINEDTDCLEPYYYKAKPNEEKHRNRRASYSQEIVQKE